MWNEYRKYKFSTYFHNPTRTYAHIRETAHQYRMYACTTCVRLFSFQNKTITKKKKHKKQTNTKNRLFVPYPYTYTHTHKHTHTRTHARTQPHTHTYSLTHSQPRTVKNLLRNRNNLTGSKFNSSFQYSVQIFPKIQSWTFEHCAKVSLPENFSP